MLLLLYDFVKIQAMELNISEKIADVFAKSKVVGTFVLYDVSGNRLLGYNETRANKLFVPASTFKIPNSLIGLATGVVKNVDEIFYRYDGKSLFLKDWERDMNLKDAIKTSNVPAYQELARRIGLSQMQKNVEKLKYGNQQVGRVVETFWLDGPLKISAVQQTQFLAELAQGKLPYPAEIQASVREIAKLEQGKDWVLYGKTGWATKDLDPTVGWFVGWVEKRGKIYSFALNMDMTNKDKDLPKRTEIAKASLKALGIL